MIRLTRAAWWLGVLTFALVLGSDARSAESDDDAKVEEYLQELFLGESAYSQDAGELQLTFGYFWNDRGDYGSTLPVLIEYGITDNFQLGVTLPTNFHSKEPEFQDGVGNVEFEAYWTYLNDAETGWVGGIGFGYGLPEYTPGASDDAYIYEPFAVLYKDFGADAVNVSGSVEIEDPRESDERSETGGNVALAYIRPDAQRPLIWLLELGTEIESEGTTTRLAPGAYWQAEDGFWEIGCSLPIGLTGPAPELGVFVLLTFEFE